MPHWLTARGLRAVSAALLVLLATTTALGALEAQAATAREHACCREAPVHASQPESPCQALVPLACCRPTTLPSADALSHRAPPTTAVALLPTPPDLGLPIQPTAQAVAKAGQRASPLRLSVVLRL